MINRRHFLSKTAAAFAGVQILPRSVFGANEKLSIAFVGAGGKGWHAVQSLQNHDSVNFAAFADVHEDRATEARKANPAVPFASDFRKMLEFSPDTGRVLLGNDRIVMFRQEAFSTLRKLMIEQLGHKLASGLLAQFGYRCGVGDHKALNAQYKWDSEIDEMSAGPVMHMWEGIVHVEPKRLEFDRKAGTFYMYGLWRNSYEAEIHLAEFGQSDRPVCHTLTGYASGWCTAFFGAPLVAVERMCLGKGDPHCAFEIKQPHDGRNNPLPR